MRDLWGIGLLATAAGIVALMPSIAVDAAAGPAAEQSVASSPEEATGAPQTAEEHLARAASYREKAASYRAEAELHRKMLAEYQKKRGSPNLKTKTGREAPWIAKMRERCEGYIEAAARLAAEADRFAEFHRMRGEEQKGQ